MPKIIHITDDFAVIFKPHGMLSEGEGDNSVPTVLREALAERGISPEGIYTVHRLDRTTEGLMVYALTKSAAARLSRIIADGEMAKEYSAKISLPESFPESGEMRDHLFFDRRRDKSFVADSARRGGKEAILTYKLTEVGEVREKPAAVARIKLQTGRTHQIRVQFGSRKAPLFGDGKYGSRVNYKRASLRCVMLSFPWRGERLTFECEELKLCNE
ncbi:MAG: RluA family pseudouridine synthase [Clostridia bacterium]|nr:RluA family pseudouridine synthase [Clostridia bacterium]